MLKRGPLLEKFERDEIKKEAHSYHKALKIFELLYQEARNLGVWDKIDILEGIETDIKLAKILNSLK